MKHTKAKAKAIPIQKSVQPALALLAIGGLMSAFIAVLFLFLGL